MVRDRFRIGNNSQVLSIELIGILIVRQYLLPLKTDHHGVMLDTSDLGGPEDQYFYSLFSR